ncbi:glutaredoxin family protein [Pseudidiomarina taiwanensis]|uniref:Thioredoxin family protein n=1 Tax=Pseudidiomarina taiwanensis TaxID=337250 RepID=A0A432ZNA2_9GAMM|nr:glutaredoxin family protein [Pseudidiomarina taiwanensis]RUO79360.1 thioredoxin family protein [Pseudidiomarina taiwanensis]
MTEFYFLTKPQCSLCEQALLLLHSLQLEQPIELQIVDISTDQALLDEYAWHIPVLIRAADDVELRWPFTATEAEEFIINE